MLVSALTAVRGSVAKAAASDWISIPVHRSKGILSDLIRTETAVKEEVDPS